MRTLEINEVLIASNFMIVKFRIEEGSVKSEMTLEISILENDIQIKESEDSYLLDSFDFEEITNVLDALYKYIKTHILLEGIKDYPFTFDEEVNELKITAIKDREEAEKVLKNYIVWSELSKVSVEVAYLRYLSNISKLKF